MVHASAMSLLQDWIMKGTRVCSKKRLRPFGGIYMVMRGKDEPRVSWSESVRIICILCRSPPMSFIGTSLFRPLKHDYVFPRSGVYKHRCRAINVWLTDNLTRVLLF